MSERMRDRMGFSTTLWMSVILTLATASSFGARPEYHERFLEDPLRRPDVQGCGVCHQDVAGGGPRNPFGTEFEDAGLVVTPMMRASFPDFYDVPTAAIGERGTIYFSDPDQLNAVVEMEEERYLIEMPSTVLPTEDATEETGTGPGGGAPENFSFFVTSVGVGRGGNLGAIAGADRHCQSLAESVGAGRRTWRAYLSTSFADGPAINAGDRIGTGPWYNINGIRIARGVADLHSGYNMLNRETALTENGTTPALHDILTGTLPDGTASDMTCENWTTSTEGTAILGHFDRQGGGTDGSSWNSAHPSQGCSQDSLRNTGGGGLFYCFAID